MTERLMRLMRPVPELLEAHGAFERVPQGAALATRLIEGVAGDLDKVARALLDAIWRAGPEGVPRKQALDIAGYTRSCTTNKAFAHLVSIGYCLNYRGNIAASEELYDR